MIERHAEHCEYLLFDHMAAVPSLVHAVFTRHGGFSLPPFQGLNASSVTGDDRATALRNRDVIESALGLRLVGAKPVHSAGVVVVERELAGEDDPDWPLRLRERLRPIESDAMISDVPGFALAWAFGDCAPILLYDPRHRAFGLVHAGWRGTARAIVSRTISAMSARYDTRPDELLAGIGPAIAACCYEVGEEVRAAFSAEPLVSASACFVERPGEDGANARLFLDVGASNYGQLVAAGVLPEHIELSGYCTGCRTDLFYSHRREPWPSGRFAVAIGLRDVRQ